MAAVLALTAWVGLACGTSDEAETEPAPSAPAPGSGSGGSEGSGTEVADPALPGPHPVGVTRFDLPADAAGRALAVEIWYPAVHDGSAVAQYELSIGPLVLAEIDSPMGAVREAAFDEGGAPRPLIVFSHGFGGVRFQSLYLTEYLASHGFVVAAPDHVGNTFAEQVNDAEALPAAEVARLRPMDISATIDALLARSQSPEDALFGACDPGRIGVAGHSFGGYTALRIAGAAIDPAQACVGNDAAFCDGWDATSFPASARDERVVAALAQAPGGAAVFSEHGFESVAVPVMIQAGTADETTPAAVEALPVYAALPGDATLVVLEGAGHFTFSDLCGWLEQMALELDDFEDGCSDEHVDPAKAHPLLVRYATAFFQSHVQRDASFASHLDPTVPRPAGVALMEAK
jgi:predicted dienelactone hydrolase